jgi:hypothetical protein
VFECFTGKPLCFDATGSIIVNPSNTYLDRVVDQIIRGVQVEVSDFQHVLAFSDPNRIVVDGHFYLHHENEIRFKPYTKEVLVEESPNFANCKCILGLTRENIMRDAKLVMRATDKDEEEEARPLKKSKINL